MTTDDKSIAVERTLPVSAQELFQVVSNPQRHMALDGSGFVRGTDHADRITAIGQKFRMNMTGEHMGGDYQTDNLVTGYERDRLLAWTTAPAGTEPPGWEWVWEFESQGPNSTDVRLTYDWSKVTDKATLSKVQFPLVSRDQLEDSLAKLGEAVSG